MPLSSCRQWPDSTAATPFLSVHHLPTSSPPLNDQSTASASHGAPISDLPKSIPTSPEAHTKPLSHSKTLDALEIDITLLEPYDSFGPIQAATAYNNLSKYLDEFGDQMTAYGQYWMERGSQVTTADYATALGRIDELKATFDDIFETYDLVLAPVARFPAFINESFPGSVTGTSSFPEQFWNGAFTMHSNATSCPAASVPAGFTPEGLPVGLQIIGPKYDEETVLAASAAFEKAHPWIHHRPPVS